MNRLPVWLVGCVALGGVLAGCASSFGGGDSGPDGPAPDQGRETAPPRLLRTEPVSPANENRPTVTGQTEPGAAVELYADAACEVPITAGVADDAGRFSLPVAVEDDRVMDIYAVVAAPGRERSGCPAEPLRYTEDSTPPAAPALLATEPESPADDPMPQVRGTAESGAAVRGYADADCRGAMIGQSRARGDGSFAMVISVAHATETALHAAAIDAAGNVSACSAALPYVELGAAVARVLFPLGPGVTSQEELIVRGVVDDWRSGALAVRVGDVEATTIDLLRNWQATVPLARGMNVFPVVIERTDGNVVPMGEVRVTRTDLVREIRLDPAYDRVADRIAMVSDETGSVYVWDAGGGEGIRLSGAGAGTGRDLEDPRAITVDADTGDVFIFDLARRVVVRVDPATGDRTDVSGGLDGDAVGSGPELVNPPRMVAASGHIYATQAGVLDIDVDTGVRSTLVEPPAYAMAWDQANGRLIVYEGWPEPLLRAVSPDGSTTLLSGTGRGAGPELSRRPRSLVVDDVTGTIWFTSRDGERDDVVEVDPMTGDRRTLALTALPPFNTLLHARDRVLTISPFRSFAQADFFRSIDLTSGERTLWRPAAVGRGPNLGSLGAIHIDEESGRMFVADSERNAILEIDRRTGARTVVVQSELLGRPAGLALDLPGRRIFALGLDYRVTSYRFGAGAPEILAAGGEAGERQHVGIAWDPSVERLVYVDGDSIVELDPATGVRRTVSGGGVGSGPELLEVSGLLVRDADSLLIGGDGQVLRVDRATGDRQEQASFGGGPGSPLSAGVRGLSRLADNMDYWATITTGIVQLDGRGRRILTSGLPSDRRRSSLTDVAVDPSDEVVWWVSEEGWLMSVDTLTGAWLVAGW